MSQNWKWNKNNNCVIDILYELFMNHSTYCRTLYNLVVEFKSDYHSEMSVVHVLAGFEMVLEGFWCSIHHVHRSYHAYMFTCQRTSKILHQCHQDYDTRPFITCITNNYYQIIIPIIHHWCHGYCQCHAGSCNRKFYTQVSTWTF